MNGDRIDTSLGDATVRSEVTDTSNTTDVAVPVAAEPTTAAPVVVPADVVERRRVERRAAAWSPAQIIGLVFGIGVAVLGIFAIVRTGFDTAHVYRPQLLVWHLPHSPLLAAIEIGWGILMVLASIVPGGVRPLIALLSAAALAFGIVVLAESLPNRLNHWLAVTHRSGGLFTVVGAIGLLAAIFSPTFVGTVHVVREHERTTAATA